MINLEYILSQTLSPRPEILSETSSCMLTISPRTLLSVTSPAAAVAAADHGVRAAIPLDLLPDGRNPPLLVLLQTAHDYPTPVHATANFPAAECTRLLWRVTLPHQTTLPVRCKRLAAARFIAKCAGNVCPHFHLFSRALSPPLDAATAVAAAAAAVAECTRPRRVT